MRPDGTRRNRPSRLGANVAKAAAVAEAFLPVFLIEGRGPERGRRHSEDA